MEYNTSLPHLILPEYGRNIHRMVDFAVTIKNAEERNKVAKAIILVMGQLNPHLRDVTDFKHKLWDHLFIMSEFKLDVESPYPKPTRETFQTKPDIVPYPQGGIRYRHYGKTLEKMIVEATKMEKGEMRDNLVALIANHMKKSYLTWNKDSVDDELILQQLHELSGGKLKLNESTKLSLTSDILLRNAPKKKPVMQKNYRKGNGGGRSHRNYR